MQDLLGEPCHELPWLFTFVQLSFEGLREWTADAGFGERSTYRQDPEDCIERVG